MVKHRLLLLCKAITFMRTIAGIELVTYQQISLLRVTLICIS